jgi:RNA polymerase sigma-70 factor (ECF subfamily)
VPLADLDVAAPDGAGNPAAAGAAHALLARLPPAERLVLTLMYFDDCQVKDIARRMGWTRAMVKMRAYRARRRLKAIAGREHLLERLGWTS